MEEKGNHLCRAYNNNEINRCVSNLFESCVAIPMQGHYAWKNVEFGNLIPGEMLLLEGNLCDSEGRFIMI